MSPMRSRRCTLEVLPPSISLDTHPNPRVVRQGRSTRCSRPSINRGSTRCSRPSPTAAPQGAPGLHQPWLHKVLPAFHQPRLYKEKTPLLYSCTSQARRSYFVSRHLLCHPTRAAPASDTRAGLRGLRHYSSRPPKLCHPTRATPRGVQAPPIRSRPTALALWRHLQACSTAPLCWRHLQRRQRPLFVLFAALHARTRTHRTHTAHTLHTHRTHTAHTPHTRRTHTSVGFGSKLLN